LRQVPDVGGGVVVMDPKSGRVLALVGGWSFRQSQFDRATQAKRQPGSSFKPFVYVTALENGFSPGSTVEDSPLSIPQGTGLPAWQPANYEGSYVGETTLEDALVHSRNLATVHVAMTIGLPSIAKTAQDFDILDKMPLYYSMALGAGDTTLLRMTAAYAMLDNNGHWLLPSVIDLVEDRTGHIVYQKGVGGCAACFVAAGTGGGGTLYRASGAPDPATSALPNTPYAANAVLYKPTKPDPLVTPDADAQIVSMLQGVVQHGTGNAVAAVGKPLAGKTGTTSDWYDAWFVGFSPDLVAGVYVGFDEPRTLGEGEAGGKVAAPIFRDFMAAALKDKPATPFALPPGAAALVASVTARQSTEDADEASDAAAYTDRDAADDRDYTNGREGREAVTQAPDDDASASDPDTRRWSGYGTPPARNYAAAPAPYTYYAAPAAPNTAPYASPYYPSGSPYPAARPPGYPPSYPAPPWPRRPVYGTGGLY
jgi:penicillin-binding protein 1A